MSKIGDDDVKRLHLVPEVHMGNGVYLVALKLAAEDGGEVRAMDEARQGLEAFDEVWVHGMWLPRTWAACRRVLAARKRNGDKTPVLVRMTHGSLSPIYLQRQSPWKKRLVAPIERHYFRLADRVVVTGVHEAEWCRQWGVCCPIEMTDLKRFFELPVHVEAVARGERPLRVLYLGRRHPLKGVNCLEAAVRDLLVKLRIETACYGADKEAAYSWCDVLVLPTLSENFGLVVAEALEHGKPVITTDGAPVWKGQAGVTYLEGYREASEERRVEMLAQAIVSEKLN